MVKRLTPRIVIEPEEIDSCHGCPFFEDRGGEFESIYYCSHKEQPNGWIEIPIYDVYNKIWEKCKLPAIENIEDKINKYSEKGE